MRIPLWALGLLVLSMASAARGDTPNLERLIEEALRENLSLQAFEHRVAAFEARVPRAGALDDLLVTLELRNVPVSSFDFDSTPMSGKAITVSQAVPFPGLRGARTAVAREVAGSVAVELRDRRLMVVGQVKQAYFGIDFLDRAVRLTGENLQLLGDIAEIAESRYAVGKGIQADVLQVRVARGLIEDKLLELRALRSTAVSRLNLLLNREPSSLVGLLRPWSPRMLTMTEADLERIALERRGLLASLDHAKVQWEAEADVARRESRPGFRFSVGYVQRAAAQDDPVRGGDFLTVQAALTIPIYRGRKQKKKEIEALERAREKTLERAWELVRIRQKIREKVIQIRQHREQHILYEKSILPQSEMAMSSALSAYRVGRTDLSAVLEAHSALLRSKLMNEHHRTAHAKFNAELEVTVGADLAGTVDLGAEGGGRE